MLTAHNSEMLTFGFGLKGIYVVPKPRTVADKVQQESNEILTEYIKQEAKRIDMEAAKLGMESNNIIDQIKLASKDDSVVRNKRDDQISAPLQTIGDLLGISTGVATRPEINIIRRNFKKLTDYVLSTDSRTANSGHTMLSIIKLQ